MHERSLHSLISFFACFLSYPLIPFPMALSLPFLPFSHRPDHPPRIDARSKSPTLFSPVRCSSSSKGNNGVEIQGYKGIAFHSEQLMHNEFTSHLIKTLKEHGNEFAWGNVTVKLAEAYGLCWGDERTVRMAFEARKEFPNGRIWLSDDIIQDPSVNKRFSEMDVNKIPVAVGKKQFHVVSDGDIVILPSFGASVDELHYFTERNVKIIDTTCPWVSEVWDTVENHKKRNYTSMIHGKDSHEETLATASLAAKYIIVNNMAEARYVCDYILGGELDGSSSTNEEFLKHFRFQVSAGFDPDNDLLKVGIGNQTTMLKGETEEIGKLIEKTMLQKYGVENVNEHFLSFNTICDAAQDRQDAMYKLLEKNLDFMLIVDRWNSSSTSHLLEIAESKGIPSYWIDNEKRIGPGNTIRCKMNHGELVVKKKCIPKGPITVGITSGTSTTDKTVENVLMKVFEINLKETLWFE